MPPSDWLSKSLDRCSEVFATFNPQDYSNTIWACAKLERLPSEDWLVRFFECSVVHLASFTGQALANTLWACSELLCCPPQAWLRRFIICYGSALDSKNESITARNVSSVLYASAVLHQPLPSELRQRLYERLLMTSGGGNGQTTLQNYANVLLAAAFLDLLDADREILQQVWDRAQRMMHEQHGRAAAASAPLASAWAIESPHFRLELSQLLQVNLAASLAGDGTAEMFNFSDPSVLKVAVEVWEADVQNEMINVSSGLEARVAGGFRRILPSVRSDQSTAPLGEALRMDEGHYCITSMRVVDIAIFATGISGGTSAPSSPAGGGGADVGQRIAVEVDGPYHFISDLETGRRWIDGSTALRNRCLALAGWKVVSVPFNEWDDLGRGNATREDEYLRVKLREEAAVSL